MKSENPAQFENCEICEICKGECKTIGQVASEFKVSIRTLRFYEQIGLLEPVRERNKRFYTDANRERISNIRNYQLAGLSLHQIRTLINDHNVSLINNYVKLRESEITNMIGRLRVRREAIDLAINAFEEILARYNTAPTCLAERDSL